MTTTIAADLESLWHLHRTALARYIRSRVDGDWVEDLLQDVFARAWAAMVRGSGYTTEPRNWLFRIAHNRVIDFYRERDRRPSTIEIDAALYRDNDGYDPRAMADAIMSPEPSPHELAESAMGCDCIWSAIGNLTDKQAVVVFLHAEGGLKGAEMASMIGQNEGASKQLLLRARLKLREELSTNGVNV